MKELITIQEKLKAPKAQYNAFGKYNYRNCEDILEAVKPLLLETKTVLIISDTAISLEGRFYIQATARLYSETGIVIAEASALAREEETQKGMNASQLTGSTSSYARKYALNGLFCIDDNKDADSTNTGETNSVISEDQAHEIADLILESGSDEAKFLGFFKVNSISDMPAGQFKKVISMLTAKKVRAQRENN